MKNLRFKNFQISETKADDKGGLTISGYGAYFGNVDSYGDRVQYGAFTESIATKKPKLWYQHDSTRPIGITLETREIPAGDPSLPEELKELKPPTAPRKKKPKPKSSEEEPTKKPKPSEEEPNFTGMTIVDHPTTEIIEIDDDGPAPVTAHEPRDKEETEDDE